MNLGTGIENARTQLLNELNLYNALSHAIEVKGPKLEFPAQGPMQRDYESARAASAVQLRKLLKEYVAEAETP
jgi:hypothetical protein